MGKTYLLTYYKEIKILKVSQGIIKTYEWFEDEEKLNDFIEENNIKPIEKLHFRYIEELK